MDRVDESVFVGTLEDAGDESQLRRHGVDTVVSLTYGDPEAGFPDFVSVFGAAMMDGPRNEKAAFESAVERVLASLQSGESVLVHCSRGASRSPSVAAAAIAVHRGIDVEEAFEQVGQRRAGFDPHDTLVRRAVEVSRALRTG
jgi:hypothetical protein